MNDLPFEYSETSPSGLVWKVYVRGSRGIGAIAGTKNKRGYWEVTAKGIGRIKSHRLVWEIFNGPVPDGLLVDHKDNNPSNNKISNLRLCNDVQSQANTRVTSGKCLPKGIHKYRDRFQARISRGGVNMTKVSKSIEDLLLWLGDKRDIHDGEFRRD